MARTNDETNTSEETNTEYDALRNAARAVGRADGRREKINDTLGDLIKDAVNVRNAVADGRMRGAHARECIAEMKHSIDTLSATAEELERAETARDDALDTAASAMDTHTEATDTFAPGDRAYDPETDGSEVLILDTPAVRTDEYVVPGTGETVADYNAGYDTCAPGDPVVEVVFAESLDAALGTGHWSVEDVQRMDDDAVLDNHVSRYAYPATRLTTEPLTPE